MTSVIHRQCNLLLLVLLIATRACAWRYFLSMTRCFFINFDTKTSRSINATILVVARAVLVIVVGLVTTSLVSILRRVRMNGMMLLAVRLRNMPAYQCKHLY
jgi:hypothetical protein